MSKKVALLFPGQGSQSVGMLSEVLNYNIIKKTFEEASAVLGENLEDISLKGPAEKLDSTEITQPAILTASVALWRLYQDKNGERPEVMAGHSLGEYSAFVCAGALEFKAAVALVSARGKFMQEAVPEGQGAMAAILGLSLEEVENVCKEAAEGKVVSPANINSPGQIVIAGETAAVDRAIELSKEKGAKLVKKLAVSVPSHCLLMKSAAEKLKLLFEKTAFQQPQIPVIQNVDAKIHATPETIKEALYQQLFLPVQWVATIEALQSRYTLDEMRECGPGKVLMGLNKRMSKVPTVSVEEILT